MNRLWLCVSAMVIITASSVSAEKVSLQDVNVFPELYAGTPIEIEGVILDGKMKKDMGFYCMGVGVPGAAMDKKPEAREGYAGRFLNMERVTFVADADLARKLLNEMVETKNYPVNIRCKIERTEEIGNVYWLARISQVDFCGPDGKITKTIRLDAAGEGGEKNADGAKKRLR